MILKREKMFFDNVEPVVNKCCKKVKSPREKIFALCYNILCAIIFVQLNLFSNCTLNYLFIESCKKKKKIFYRILNVILCVKNVIVKRLFGVN